MRHYRETKECTKEQRINSYLFELSLWKTVKISDPDSGKFEFDNAEYHNDDLFPWIEVGGYNELNGFEEEFMLPCYIIISDWSRSDWIEEYEKNGDSPAAKSPHEVMSYIKCAIINLETEFISSIKSSQALADIYVNALMKYKFYEDVSYDYEEGTEDSEKVLALSDAWSDISDKLEQLIVNAASDEGLLARNQPNLDEQIKPFMNKYGYFYHGNWWTKKED